MKLTGKLSKTARALLGSKSRKKYVKKEGFVYALMQGSDVVYVGQACAQHRLFCRIESHRCNKRFDAWKYIRVDLQSLSKVEAQLIRELKPFYNSMHNENDVQREIRNVIRDIVASRMHKGYTFAAVMFEIEVEHPNRWTMQQIEREFMHLKARRVI